jgi:hypothetical protein
MEKFTELTEDISIKCLRSVDQFITGGGQWPTRAGFEKTLPDLN